MTKQTPPGGVPVSKVMVAEAIDITRETYFCILMDRESNGPVIIASPDGGVDIEEVYPVDGPDRVLSDSRYSQCLLRDFFCSLHHLVHFSPDLESEEFLPAPEGPSRYIPA